MRNTVLEQVKTLTRNPWAKPNHILLAVDLSEVEEADKVLNRLVEKGYNPEICYMQYKIGLHVFAILKEEPFLSEEQYEAIEDEWEQLCYEFCPPDDLNKAVRLWRRVATKQAIVAA